MNRNRDKQEELAKPEGLTAEGERAYSAIMGRLKAKYQGVLKEFSTGGCRSFYSPAEWKARGEEYGLGSVLVVVYDGGDLRRHFNMDAAYEMSCMLEEAGITVKEPYASLEKMQEALNAEGFYFEECTGWYGAVYKR